MSEPATKDSRGRPCVPSIIDGQPIVLPPTSSFAVTSAKEGKIIHYGQTTSIEMVNAAVDSSSTALKTYQKTRVSKRQQLLLRTAELFEARRKEAVFRQIQETSCPDFWAELNVSWVSDGLRSIAGSVSAAVVGEIPPSDHGCTSLVLRQPIGVVLIIPP